jgi:hypothetical protein
MPPEPVSARTREQVSGPASSLTRAEWPALLRMIDRIDPSYKD